MDRIINRINEGHSYYKNQLKVYNKTGDFMSILRHEIDELKD